MTDEEKIAQTEEAPNLAVSNQFSTMLHERWIASNRIRALKAEMARRATS